MILKFEIRNSKFETSSKFLNIASYFLLFASCLLACIVLMSPPSAFAQGERAAGTAGCTDPTASNYNPSAQVDDSSCVDGERKKEIEQMQAANAARQNSTGGTDQRGKFVPLAEIPGLTSGEVAGQKGLATFFNNLYKYLIGLSATLAVVMIIWGGLEYATQDAPGAKRNGKERIQQAILGLVLVLAPALVFSIINPAILNLSVNLPELETQSGGSNTRANNRPSTTDPVSGCSSTGGEYFKTVTCPSAEAATKFSCGSENFTLQVLACKKTDAGTGKCLDTSTTAYCTGRNITIDVYQYYQSYTGVLRGDALPVPRDAAAANAFVQGCTGDGGEVSYSLTTAARAFIASHAYQISTATNGCSTDSGVVFDSSKGGGIACFGNVVSCELPD